ncbi:MAG: 2-amino-4-hydroxy-6-hydroxymethyldihydropteridine diphosphokinase [Thermodesulfobacteriota bacterium]
MANAYIGIGSNQGNRIDYCRKALRAITKFAVIKSLSSVYETEPVGVVDQPDFINCAVEIETGLGPYALLSRLLDIENELGRKRVGAGGPRTIDLDLIFYDDLVIQGEELTIPHPRAHLRRFVLEPLREIAPDFIHPILKVSVSRLLHGSEETKRVKKVGDFSTIIPQ